MSTVIPGASCRAQLEENLAALALAPKLTPELLSRVDGLTKALAS